MNNNLLNARSRRFESCQAAAPAATNGPGYLQKRLEQSEKLLDQSDKPEEESEIC